MAIIRSVIRGVGAYLPKRVMTNDDLALLVERAGQNLIAEAPRISGHGVKALFHIDPVEFQVALVVTHDDLLYGETWFGRTLAIDGGE